jgi:hypothetical protein
MRLISSYQTLESVINLHILTSCQRCNRHQALCYRATRRTLSAAHQSSRPLVRIADASDGATASERQLVENPIRLCGRVSALTTTFT